MKSSLAAILAAVALMLAVPACGVSEHAPATATDDARTLVANGALLLDVRTPSEFASGHIDGAVNIPVQELERRIAEIHDRRRPIVVYCQSGRRSAAATQMLRSAGYAEVHDLGPMSAW